MRLEVRFSIGGDSRATCLSTRRRQFGLHVFVLVCSASAFDPAVAGGSRLLEAVGRGEPELDAGRAIDAGDERFLGIGGLGSRVPGVDSDACFVDRGQARIVDEVSDTPSRKMTRELRNKIIAYEIRYNAVMLKRLDGRVRYRCVQGAAGPASAP